ncbi:MAG: pyrroline-5-carboxylate reductase [Phycisphaerales bacterium]
MTAPPVDTTPATPQERDQPPCYAFLGGGAMASAIIEGAINAATHNASQPPRFLVADPNPEKRARFERQHHTRAVPTAADLHQELLTATPDALVLAVKPQVFPDIATEWQKLAPLPALPVISIMAGTTLSTISDSLGANIRPIRIMPNTPASIGLGCSAIAPAPASTPRDIELATDLMASVGTVTRLPESLIDAFTAVAGSGPALLFAYAEAVISAAIELGIPRDQADPIVRQTLLGSISLMTRDPAGTPHPTPPTPPDIAALRTAVTSPGGTTAAALKSLSDDDFPTIIARALTAARNRGRALSDRGTE